jgi:cobalt-zinc-cadmium efflux system membrane fusion protein
MIPKTTMNDEKTRLQMTIVGLCIVVAGLLGYLFLTKPAAGPSTQPVAETAATPAPAVRAIQLAAEAQKEANLAVEEIKLRSEKGIVQANGQVALNENETWHVGALAEGKVTQIFANVGDRVKKGQILAYMHSHAVHETRAAYLQAEAELERAKSQRELATRSADRAKRLLQLQAVSQEQADSAMNDLRSAETTVKKAQAALERENQHLTEFLDVSVDATHKTNPAVDDDAVPIRAPSAGTMIRRLVGIGSVLGVGQEAFTIADLSKLWVIAAVNEADLAAVRSGVAARVSVRAYPDRWFPGRVLQLGEGMDPATRTLKVRIAVQSQNEALKPEMFAQVEIEKQAQAPALYLPDSAIQEVDGQRIAFVQSGPESFEPRTLKLGVASGRQVEVTGGIQAGDKVVTRGAFLLKSELLKSRLQGE